MMTVPTYQTPEDDSMEARDETQYSLLTYSKPKPKRIFLLVYPRDHVGVCPSVDVTKPVNMCLVYSVGKCQFVPFVSVYL